MWSAALGHLLQGSVLYVACSYHNLSLHRKGTALLVLCTKAMEQTGTGKTTFVVFKSLLKTHFLCLHLASIDLVSDSGWRPSHSLCFVLDCFVFLIFSPTLTVKHLDINVLYKWLYPLASTRLVYANRLQIWARACAGLDCADQHCYMCLCSAIDSALLLVTPHM